MRYCSLSTRAYDTLHHGPAFFTALSPVFVYETVNMTLLRRYLDPCTVFFSTCDMRCLFGRGQTNPEW